MPTVTIFHRLPRQMGGHRRVRVCDRPLARVRIERRDQAHAAAWAYQRQRLAETAVLCPGCGLPIGNHIGYRITPDSPSP